MVSVTVIGARAKLKPERVNLPKLRAIYRKAARAGLRDYKSTVRTWKGKPEFKLMSSSTKDGFAYVLGTDNIIYKWTDEGTKAHKIRAKLAGPPTSGSVERPKRQNFENTQAPSRERPPSSSTGAKRLKFRAGFVSKTVPSRLSSRQAKFFGPFRSPVEVNHPGTKARDFTPKIQEKMQKQITSEVQAWLKKSSK